ncbi:ictacalcin-like [Platichthys flesus]|uniref:ictacalcin-like n=1 Tax=Platichthys flesus TaxID=8260 RepID=UPI002DB6065F|nr:ictacalcin-like [Platichthys flesus]XP_062265186.1 ictacalcin-like [Platichthys flesus]
MSEVQQAMVLLISAFHRYSGKEGDNLFLSRSELKDLLENELKEMLGKANDKAAIDRIFKDLDANKDNKVDFAEYVSLVCSLTQMCHEFFVTKKQ